MDSRQPIRQRWRRRRTARICLRSVKLAVSNQPQDGVEGKERTKAWYKANHPLLIVQRREAASGSPKVTTGKTTKIGKTTKTGNQRHVDMKS